MDLEGWIASGIAVIAAGVSAWQAHLARVQAREARAQAESAERQAVVAERQLALLEEDRRKSQPQFRITALPIKQVETRRTADGEIEFTGHSELGEVQVTVENTSTRNATVNHSGICCLEDSSETIEGNGRDQLPHDFGPGGQLSWRIPGSEFLNILEASEWPEAEFTVFVDQDPSFSRQSGGRRRWESTPFTVHRPQERTASG